MDRFTENLTEGLRRFAMAGVGAIALTIDKSKEIIDKLAERGEASAADGKFACDELQKKMTEQLNAFTQKLKADYEAASFEQLISRCQKLTPEQKAQLVDLLTREPEPEDAPEEESESGPAEDTTDIPCAAAAEPGAEEAPASEKAADEPESDSPEQN